jgi:hypothetical protein
MSKGAYFARLRGLVVNFSWWCRRPWGDEQGPPHLRLNFSYGLPSRLCGGAASRRQSEGQRRRPSCPRRALVSEAGWRHAVNYESNVLESNALELSEAERASVQGLYASVSSELSRLGSGLALSAVFGLALGARVGGLGLLRHALGAPLGLLVVAGVAAPALFVRLSLMDAPLRAEHVLRAVAGATFASGLVLAGLSPAMAMLVVSIESAGAAAWISGLGLALAGGIGLASLFGDLSRALNDQSALTKSRVFMTLAVFAVLSCALAARAWCAWLPVLGGAS